ncbi:MAG: ATP-binding cassette domain-containing protein [Desulfovibrio sp.]|nr:ATP-binding cassette domain-containing protein [Desulfovibrio sp.]
MVEIKHIWKTYLTRRGPRDILKDICFSIQKGDKLGILGCNGAGKSTLIRIISGAELPTSGEIVRGMTVSWPLALQGGFVGNLTGTDNLRFICRVYDVDYDQAFRQVSDFSELGHYLDEPVRTYSSGMRARLAFAISMAVDFDCYLIDELSAVGDRRFNKKFKDVLFGEKGDRSLIMVSHFYGVIQEYCNKVAVLDQGRLALFEDTKEAIATYDRVLAGQHITF